MALEQCTSVTEKLIYNREGDAPSGVNRAHTHALRAELPFLRNYSSPVRVCAPRIKAGDKHVHPPL